MARPGASGRRRSGRLYRRSTALTHRRLARLAYELRIGPLPSRWLTKASSTTAVPRVIIDAVGVDAQRPQHGPATDHLPADAATFEQERRAAAPEGNISGQQWLTGESPSLAARRAVEAVAKAGTVGIIGVYPPTLEAFPIGQAMNRNLTIQAGNCNHRRYVPGLLARVARGDIDPTKFITQQSPPTSMVDAYEQFDRRHDRWVKTVVPM